MLEKKLVLSYFEQKPIAYVCINGEIVEPVEENSRNFSTWKEVEDFAKEKDCCSIESSAGYARHLFREAALFDKDLYNAITGEILCSDIGDERFHGLMRGYVSNLSMPEEEMTDFARSCLNLKLFAENEPLEQTNEAIRRSILREDFEERFFNEIGWIAN